MRRHRFRASPARTAALLALVLLSTGTSWAQDDAQRKLLESLLAGRDPAAPPAGLEPATWAQLVPADNQMTAARVALGQRLYFETALSSDGAVSCNSCHDVGRGFADPRPVSLGVAGRQGTRNAPSILNAALLGSQFWDGRVATLELQAAGPIFNPAEMGMRSQAAVVTALEQKGYGPAFRETYARPISVADVARALAAFERTLVFVRAPFDRYIAGEAEAISPAARAGWRLFRGRGKCSTCHTIGARAPLGTDNRFHNIGISARRPGYEALVDSALATLRAKDPARQWQQLVDETDVSPLGRFVVTRDPADLGAFRSSPLRNVALTAPYMHDGSMATLWDTIDYYDNGGAPHAQLDRDLLPLDLQPEQIDQLVAFLFSLTDDRFADQNQAELARQQSLAATSRPIRDQTGPMVRVRAAHARATPAPR